MDILVSAVNNNVDMIVNILAAINRNNIYTKFIQKDDMKDAKVPDLESNKEKYKIYKNQDEYLERYSFIKKYDRLHDYTLYRNIDITNKSKRSPSCVLYVPGSGRNFTLMNLNTLYEDNGMDLLGIDLPNYGDSYRMKNKNVNYNTIVDIDEYFQALNHAIETVRSTYGYKTIILMGHDIGGLICTNYILNSRYTNKPDALVLESPLFKFKNANVPISPVILYSLIPDLIIDRHDNDPLWLYPFFTDGTVPTRHNGFVDYWYNPLSNRPEYVSYMYHVSQMCENITSISQPITNIPIFFFCNSTTDIDVVRKITSKCVDCTDSSYRHEIMLDYWVNVKKCVEKIGSEIRKLRVELNVEPVPDKTD